MFKKLVEGQGYNCIVESRYGYMVYNRNDIYVGKSFENYGEFSESEAALFRQVCVQSDRVVDVGANIGAHTLMLARQVGPSGRVYAFEPQRVVFQTLCANMSINSIGNTECFQMAVSNKSGFINIPDVRYDLEGNFGGFEIEKYSQSGIKTAVVSLDEILDLPTLKLIKIDVEGMELGVVQGARETIRKHTPILYVENDRVDKSKALIEEIGSLGYRLFWHRPPLFNPNNYARNPNNIFGGIVSVNMLCLHKKLSLNLKGFDEIIDSDDHPLHKK